VTAPAPTGDAAARARAATDFSVNLCVTAGAGCGKTSLLVERVLFAVLARATPIERIVAITFTDKAAAEMSERVQSALAAVGAALASAGTLAEAATAAREEAGRTLGRIAALPAGVTPAVDVAAVRARAAKALAGEPATSTIHSFSLRLLSRHPIESDIPADVAMDVGEGFRRHVERYLPEVLEELLDESRAASEEAQSLRRVLSKLRLDEFAPLARGGASLPEEVPGRPPDPMAPLRARCAELAAAMDRLRTSLTPKGNQAALYRQWDAASATLRVAARLDAKLPFARTGADADALAGSRSSAKPHSADARVAEEARAHFEEAFELARALRSIDESVTGDAVIAARAVGRRLAASFATRGFLHADEVLARAARLLARSREIRRAEAAAFDLLLVDEFQDTDPLQCEIVLWLAESSDGAPARSAFEARLAPGRLFLVGDPKQSIYRFRGADLEAYGRARRRLLEQGGEELLLTSNFRSRPEVIATVNGLFAPWIGPSSEFEPDYVPFDACRDSANDARTGVALVAIRFDAQKTNAPERRRAEGRVIAEEIAALHARGIGYGKIALLLRRLTDLGAYVQPLRDRSIPHVLAGGRTFVERSEVGELMSLLLAVADPEDEVASLGALRSTLCAVPDADLYAAKAECGSLRWPGLAGCRVGSVARAARELARLHAIVRSEPAAGAVERVVEGSLLLPLSGAARDGEQRVANLRKLAAQVVARVDETQLPLALALRDLLATHERSDGESERSLADEDVDAVRVLTIHGAKGLEFDHVFVADLVEEGRHGGRSSDRIAALETSDGPRAAVDLPSLGVRNVADLLRSERELRHEVAENKRLFYVACTRARERLLLVSSAAAGDESPWIAPLGALGYVPGGFVPEDGRLPSGVHHRVVLAPARSSIVAAPTVVGGCDDVPAAKRFAKAAAAARTPLPRFARPSDAEGAFEREQRRGEDDRDDPPGAAADGPADEAARLAKAVGIACHVALAASGPATAPSAAQIANAAQVAARDAGVAADAVERAATELLRSAPVRALQASLAGVQVRAVELPLLLARDGVVWRGSADLVFEEKGELVVGDWKSDRGEDTAALAAFAARYRPQLELYRDAVAAALGTGDPARPPKRPRIELLLLRAGRRLAL
jgi:ATP-dependent helicase/nuclease subunit A